MNEPTGVVEVEARGLSLKLPADPVYLADARDHGTLLLADTMEVRETDRVLAVWGGSGLLALVAARLAGRGQVTVACSQVSAADLVSAAARLGAGPNLEVAPVPDLSALRGREFDVALVPVALAPDGASLDRCVEQVALLLASGGRCYLTGGKREGILSAAERARAVFGNVATVAYRKGHRVLVARREGEARASWEEPAERVEEVTLRGRTFRIGVREGVFAEGRLDEGTRLLSEALEIRPRDVALDLGCGGGLVGMVAAALAPEGQVYLADSDLAAVALARENLRRNGVANAVALASDAYSALGGLVFDVVVTNPPFHVGRHQTTAIAERFVVESPRHLRRGGRFYLVANRFLKYEPRLAAAFGNVETVAETSRYKVLRSVWQPSVGPARRSRAAPG